MGEEMFESGFSIHNDSSDGELLRDIEEISNALYSMNKTHENSVISYSNYGPKSHFSVPKPNPKPGFDREEEWLKEEHKQHSSIWGWKPFKALSHIIRQRKFTCYFFCHVHCIENLTLEFKDVCMSVHWKRKDVVLKTRPSRVSNGMVEFEETLMSKCTVTGSKNGHGGFVKYEPKHFLLYVSIVGAEGLEIGKHWVDLTRLLPLTLEELEQDRCSGKWSTSFKLAGKANGATLHVSLGFLVTKDGLAESGSCIKPQLALSLEGNELNRTSSVDSGSVRGNTSLRRVESVPSSLNNASCYSSQCLDAKIGGPKDEYDFSNSIDMLYGKLEEGRVDSLTKFDKVLEQLESIQLSPNSLSSSVKVFCGTKHDDAEFTVIEKGVESECSPKEAKKLDECIPADLEASAVEIIDVADIFKGEEICSEEETKVDHWDEALNCVSEEAPIDKYSVDTKESDLEEEALDLLKMFISQSDELEMSEDDMSVEIKAKHKGSNLVKSLSLNDFERTVADDFCNLLQDLRTPSNRSFNGGLESPRERLLKQFEEDMMTSGSLFLGADVQDDVSDYDFAASGVSSLEYNVESVDLSPFIDTAGLEANESFQQSLRNKLKAKSLERLETQTLMQRWGLNEEAFQSSPYYSTGGFGSPVFVPAEEPIGLPPLAEGLESLLHLKDGGYLRSMSPLLFKNANNCGSLIMQTSKTLVLPTELGSDIMEILQYLASVGYERLSKKMHNLLPMEDLSGKIMQQIAWEASCYAEVSERSASPQYESNVKIEVESPPYVQGCNYFSSRSTGSDIRSEYVAAKDLALLTLDRIEALMIEGLKIQSGMPDHNAPSSIRVKSVKEVRYQPGIDYFDDSSDYVNGLLDLSISLAEWLRLDAGMSGDENQDDKSTMNVLRAHHAKCSYFNNKSAGENNTENESRNCGILGDNLTLVMMMQLRDPLRNYEPVGGPMLCLIQVKRLIEPVNLALEDDKVGEGMVSRFRLDEAHVAGLNIESDNLETWSSRRHKQSGSRWLLASGLTKNCNSRFSKSKSIIRISSQVLRKPWTRNFIWSLSHPIHEVEADPLNPLTRNADVIFPQMTV
ncbi:protein PLASTID MOVEMENT IMPAIRED 1-RELATED 1-like [Chenopodium quinoa]|uniref:C2 NT-type domain-containing protein n=1 Tax=Chenopodium quinoa TaxID=63459 RepID=A0A803LB66_CHEQI|nr:protein PLASTID MOVEMENT IMPAIRED 1-RELATED 1-like [Chenopodium quinoa]